VLFYTHTLQKYIFYQLKAPTHLRLQIVTSGHSNKYNNTAKTIENGQVVFKTTSMTT